MYYFKKLNENYFIYFYFNFCILSFKLYTSTFDGVFIDYALETGNLKTVDFWYKDASRYVHFL